MSNRLPAENPPTPSRARLAVTRIKEGQKLHVRSLVDAYGGLMTHYKGRSVYCDRNNECRLCRTHPDRIWKGYFAAEAWDPVHKWWVPTVMELTERCELDLRHRFARGQTWLFSRAEQVSAKKTPVVASLFEEHDPASVPLPFEIYGALRILYHVQHIDLTTKNPLPDMVFVEPTRDTGPAPAGMGEKPGDKRTFAELEAEMRSKGWKPGAVGMNGHANHG